MVKVIYLCESGRRRIESVQMAYLRLALGEVVHGMCGIRVVLIRYFLARSACLVVPFPLPWSCQGLLVSRVLHVMQFKSILIDENDFHFLLHPVGVLNFCTFELAVEGCDSA